MNLSDVHQGVQKHKKTKRLGRGKGSGQGKTAGRGHKGQGALAGWTAPAIFEGGRMPLIRQIPKRGFHNRFAKSVAIVNLADLEKYFAAGETVSRETLKAKKIVRGAYDVLKVLAKGELTKALTVTANRFSQAAAEKIQKAGGQAVVLGGQPAGPDGDEGKPKD